MEVLYLYIIFGRTLCTTCAIHDDSEPSVPVLGVLWRCDHHTLVQAVEGAMATLLNSVEMLALARRDKYRRAMKMANRLVRGPLARSRKVVAEREAAAAVAANGTVRRFATLLSTKRKARMEVEAGQNSMAQLNVNGVPNTGDLQVEQQQNCEPSFLVIIS